MPDTAVPPETEKARQDNVPWERGKFFKEYELMMVDYLVASVWDHAAGRSLLDVACGNGLVTSRLAARFQRVVGIDASSSHVAMARQNHPNMEFIECLAEDFPLDERFSTVTLLNLLEHVSDPVSLLRSLSNRLEDEGVMIINVPNAMALNRRIATLMGTLEHEHELSPYDIEVAGHRRYYDMESLVADVTAAGLKIVKKGGVFHKSLSQAQFNWLLEKGEWSGGGFGWGRVGAEKSKDWRKAFCDACYEYGKMRPDECNLIYIVATH